MADSPRQAGQEIEITPAMIVAGADALHLWVRHDADEGALQFIPSDEAVSALVSGIFSSMLAARPEDRFAAC